MAPGARVEGEVAARGGGDDAAVEEAGGGRGCGGDGRHGGEWRVVVRGRRGGVVRVSGG